ncbi:hypothetical protein BST95_11535 [Halioglobus japonicus]|uniref:Uncharacterized protein n=1 Tax=Halioglobus japonicus TaxID=930805 RepID=A0AAP8SNT4_9GAMM|nr:hypothetical protein [Halioglobus japonicus]AQA18774.1 hypothetical protein BST95_11535 [Halioglobus japonicus]PLW86806.1 hypothetical protein C0029_10535 [Halioglobus japonicus]GHD10973.1 hypothetical protein GCM10007052_10180 [Halioglobus japonicus]
MSSLPLAVLEQQISAQLIEGAYLVTTGRELVMEVVDAATGLVWMSTVPVTVEYFHNLALDEGLSKVGIASASMDSAGFQCSPGREGEAVLTREIDGKSYINVARPMAPKMPTKPGGPIEIEVDKHHVLGFEAGRTLAILRLPEGDFVEVVGDNDQDDALVLPDGAELITIELAAPWVVALPAPTRAFFWMEQGMRSFQGPVRLP